MLMRAQYDAPSRGRRRAALFLTLWLGLSGFEAIDTLLKNSTRGWTIPLAQALFLGLALWLTWGLLALAAVAFVRRFPIDRANWWHRIPLALAFAVLLALVKIALDYPAIEAFYCPTPGLIPFPEFYRGGFAVEFHSYVLIALGIVAIVHAWHAYRAHHRHEIQAWQLEARLAQTQLQLLRAQLHPHFLFNTLGALSHLIRHDADEADRVLARLGELLRHLLDTSGEAAVLLGQELHFLHAYLDIEQTRFGDRLTVQFFVEPGVESALVPPLVLQPLVENALRHGVARCQRPVRVEVRARRVDGRLRLEVWNDGPALAPSYGLRARKSVGLTNTRARLEHLYGDEARLEIRNEAVGVLALLELPFAEEALSPVPMPTPAAAG